MKSKMPYYHNATERIFKNAKELRRNETPAEERLWKILRSHKLDGLKFRRQHPVSWFIADFYCHELKLIIELDGDIHELEEVKAYDIRREKKLSALGLTVIRFKNEQVYTEPEVILNRVLELRGV